MAHRTYRLSISPRGVHGVRRVVELDGRSSLHDLHLLVGRSFGLPLGDELYAFALTGDFSEESAVFVGPGAEGKRANQALLFRLGLRPGESFGYVRNDRSEQHLVLSVLDVNDSDKPLSHPTLVLSEGQLEPQAPAASGSSNSEPMAVLYAQAFLIQHRRLDDFEGPLQELRVWFEPWKGRGMAKPVAPPVVPTELLLTLQGAAACALQLLSTLQGEAGDLARLHLRFDREDLGLRLVQLPLLLSAAGEVEAALELVRALSFFDRELMSGDRAVILARAGRREEALAQLEQNLTEPQDRHLAESKAGDTYYALGDLPAAEAYQRRALSEATNDTERNEAKLRLVWMLLDADRTQEARQLLAGFKASTPTPVAAVGRNDSCPCGSGKKYKKCHGA